MTSPVIVLEVDGLAEAAYVRFGGSEVVRTVAHDDAVNIDLDEYGVVVGIEILDLCAEIPFTALVTQYHVESTKVELLRRLRPSVSGFVSRFEVATAGCAQVTTGSLASC